MTANKLSFKVYLVNEDPWTCTEVRRFGIDADVATNFIYLREKLQTIFPDLRGKRFNVTWKDDENESITISTDEELEIALHEMAKNMICKLYIMLQSEQEIIDMSKIEKIQHPGVICDVCDKAICGFRFKCMQCADYDLCIDCMTLGNHTEHYMVRMTQPIVWSSYHARRLAHHVRKFVKKAAYHYKEDERKCNEPHKNKSKRGSCPVFNADDICAGPSDENQERKRTKEQYREPSAEAATEATEDSQQEATRHSFSQLLKIVEDNISNISQFLDPLGINVTVMADNDSSNKKSADSTQKANTQKPETRASTSSEDSAKKFPGEGKKLRNDPVNTAATPLENAQKDSITAAAVASPTASATATSAEQAAEAEEWTMIQRESPSISRTSSTSSSNGTLPKQATPFAPTAPVPEPEKSSSNQKIYPPLPEEVKNEFYHPNPKIQNAVEAMMAMGFTNEGSWLTHLLIAQNGDIDKALDVIHPIRRH
ncbi:PREDICTED: sequestosome-1 isoform X2 [Trachymyrmex septentrionalis]|uniref:sequestosome-1 isoform X2 n=1 Tax=Trachymyrmex septentrionalis TaxID=34720 RepID=UPI00084EF165|nr:PREDICTED: sequestosome-1 isoform X2 [Trachymyrmex septentrionalis]